MLGTEGKKRIAGKFPTWICAYGGLRQEHESTMTKPVMVSNE